MSLVRPYEKGFEDSSCSLDLLGIGGSNRQNEVTLSHLQVIIPFPDFWNFCHYFTVSLSEFPALVKEKRDGERGADEGGKRREKRGEEKRGEK